MRNTITPNQRTSNKTNCIPLLLGHQNIIYSFCQGSRTRVGDGVERYAVLRKPGQLSERSRAREGLADILGMLMRLAITVLLGGLLLGAVACAVARVSLEGEVREWQGQIVKLDHTEGYVVVRSRERLLDHVFRITSETEITSQALMPPHLELGQQVTVQYHDDKTQPGLPAALRIVVIP